MTQKHIYTQITKVDEGLGLILGYAIVCTEGGKPYVDLQNDHIPEDAMLKCALEFMEKGRVLKEMHDGDQIGTVVFAWPLTTEIAKAFEIQSEKTGLMIGVRPSAEILAKAQRGEFSGFSIGGLRLLDEEMDE